MCWCDFGRGGGLEEWGRPKLASTAPRSTESPILEKGLLNLEEYDMVKNVSMIWLG